MTGTVYVFNDDSQYFLIHYHDNGDPDKRAELESGWQSFNRQDPGMKETYKIWVRPSNHIVEVTVDHLLPPETSPGIYQVETFIPGKHATSRKAIFTIGSGVELDEGGQVHLEEKLSIVDMQSAADTWQPLGHFHLDTGLHPEMGRVRQYDLSREDPPTEISFGPVRWVPLTTVSDDGKRFDAPVGLLEERAGLFPTGQVIFGKYPLWAGQWFDVNPFLNWYTYGYHTGADLNLPGSSAADKGKPIYSIADGLVTYAGKAGTWGSIVVIEHPEALVTYPDGHQERQRVYSRYGHVEPQIPVRAGESVARGQLVGQIGLAAGASAGWHLHFDVSYTDILKSRPAHWPDLTALRSMQSSARNLDSHAYQSVKASIMRQVVSHYVDPLRFIQENHSLTAG